MPHVACPLSLSGNDNLEKLNYFCSLHNYRLFFKVAKQWSDSTVVSLRLMSSRFDRKLDTYVSDVALVITKVVPSTDMEATREIMSSYALKELGVA